MERVHAWRLLVLARKLYKVRPEKFTMKQWYKNAGECGTAGCAMGYACTMPIFKPYLSVSHPPEGNPYPWYSCVGKSENERLKRYNSYFHSFVHDGWSGFNAIQAFFGISEKDSEWLFGSDSYNHISNPATLPMVVANRLRNEAGKHFPGLVKAFDKRYPRSAA